MKKNNFGKVFGLTAAAVAVFALVFGGCEDLVGKLSGKKLEGEVTITGTPRVGSQLTAEVETNATGALAYAWQRQAPETEENPDPEWKTIQGENETTYTPVEDDIGYYVRVVVKAEGYNNELTEKLDEAVDEAEGGNGNENGENGGDEDPPGPIEFSNKDYSSGTSFDGTDWTGAGADGEAWTLTAGEYGTVYFAVNKTAGQTITVGGADAARVTKHESGSVEGAVIDDGGGHAALAAGDTLTVFAVKTGDLLFEGGTRTFTLDGGDGRAIPVTLNVTPNLTGAAVFLVEREGDYEDLTRKDTGTSVFSYLNPNSDTPAPAPFNGNTALMDALAWADYHTASNQEWLIRVEAAENQIPRTILTGGTWTNYNGYNIISQAANPAGNIKIRLRGHGGTEHIIKHDLSNALTVTNNFYGRGIATENGNGSEYLGPTKSMAEGMINVAGYDNGGDSDCPSLTLQLEKGITLQGRMTENPKANTSKGPYWYKSMVGLLRNSALVMKADSKISGHYLDSSGSNTNKYSVIQLTSYAGNPAKRAITIEAGAAITGNKLTAFTEGNKYSSSKSAIIYMAKQTIIFISKKAVIQNNVREGEDNVNNAYNGAAYDIRSDGNRAEDIIITPQ